MSDLIIGKFMNSMKILPQAVLLGGTGKTKEITKRKKQSDDSKMFL